ncbi:hypothetical protein AKJ52_00770 [candidate division MSBL1 archaeon SCGC-AAA382C18]|uniref:Nucleotide pyrophosphatase n=1 Tax=candidate division MSBL1 archaeon SCGC-AAA382C18 TaxID=1698281 RepID=A0A133VL88_9EURY|nr:hypothetical protein AKJ52_00770 [candidate division MSBL1 archaeon SCGC-AAA382C18]
MVNDLLLLGVDGGSLKIVKEMVEEGELPTFEMLLENGVYGALESTIPPITKPAWPSMFTGLNPASLGAVDHLTLDEKYEEVLKSPDWRGQFFWDFLNEEGIKTGIVNPPRVGKVYELNGFMVSGLTEKGDVFPKDFQIDQNVKPLGEAKSNSQRISLLLENLEEKKNILLSLIPKDWNMLLFVINETDYVSHFADDWRPVREVYRKVDELLSEVLDEIHECNLLMASDHGIKKIRKRVYVNEMLKQMNLLRKSEGSAEKLLPKIVELSRKILGKGFLQTVSNSLPFVKGWEVKSMMSLGNIDMQNTQMFGYGMRAGSYARLWINSEEKFTDGIVKKRDVESVKKKFREKATNLDSSEDFIEKIYKGPEVYAGKTERWIPDLIVKLSKDCVEDYKLAGNIASDEKGFAHDLHGIFMGYGPDIDSHREVENPKIYDIAPTILHALETPVPNSMEGRVLTEIFEKGTEPYTREIKYRKEIEKEREKVRKEIESLKREGKI